MIQTTPLHRRDTKYCRSILEYLQTVGHATNAMILEELRKTYPQLSATTVHRATARLAETEEITFAPPDTSGSMRYDINNSEHDHFMCTECGCLRDVDIVKDVLPIIENQLEGCRISGRINVSGICKNCSKGVSNE